MLVIRCNKLLSDKQFNKYVEMFNAQVKKNGFLILPAEFNVVTNREGIPYKVRAVNNEGYICDPVKNVSCKKGASCQTVCFHTTNRAYAVEDKDDADSDQDHLDTR